MVFFWLFFFGRLYFSDGVGGVVIFDSGGFGVVGGDGSDDFGGVGDVFEGVGVGGEGKDGSGEFYFDWFVGY